MDSVAWSLSHPFGDERKSSSTKGGNEPLFVLLRRRISFSGYYMLKTCPAQFFLGGPATWNGWFPDAPEFVRRAYSGKSRQGAFAHFGQRGHMFSALADYNLVDQVYGKERGRRAVSDERLLQRAEHRLEQDWEQSSSMTTAEYARVNRKEAVWLTEHFYGAYNHRNDADRKAYFFEWTLQPLRRYLEMQREILALADVDDWKVIEGRYLLKGEIVRQNGEAGSEEELRKTTVYPSAVIEVDGELWEYGYTLDRLVFNRRSGVYYIIDVKFGKRNEHHLEQQKIYGALLIRANPEITRHNLTLRLAYIAESKETVINDYRFDDDDDVRRSLELVRKHCRTYRSYLLPIARYSIEERKQLLLRMYPQSMVVGERGEFLAQNFPPDQLIALPDQFAPKPSDKLDPDKCKRCAYRWLCPEGTDLVAKQW